MIRQCHDREFEAIYSIINDAAQAYIRDHPGGPLERALHAQERVAARDGRGRRLLGVRRGRRTGGRDGHLTGQVLPGR
jgi:hypothetical protein